MTRAGAYGNQVGTPSGKPWRQVISECRACLDGIEGGGYPLPIFKGWVEMQERRIAADDGDRSQG